MGSPVTKGSSKKLQTLSKVQADLLFKKHTGIMSKSKLPPSTPQTKNQVKSSFSLSKEQDAKKEKLVGLNRMDYETFLLALSDIANQLYDKFYQEGT